MLFFAAPSSRRKLIISCAFLVIAILVIFFSQISNFFFQNELKNNSSVNKQADEMTASLQTHMDVYTQILYDTRGLLLVSKDVSRLQWQKFFQSLGIVKRLPGLAVLEYVVRVPDEKKAAFVQQVKSDDSILPEGFPDFTIHPDRSGEEALVLTYAEPGDYSRYQQYLGFDFNSIELRRVATAKAIETNKPTMINPAVGLISKKPAFFIILPTYNPELPSNTAEERKKALTGLVVEGFRIDELFNQVFEDILKTDASVKVFDTSVSPENLLYDSTLQTTGQVSNQKKVTIQQTALIADKTFVIEYQLPSPAKKLFPSNYLIQLTLLLLVNCLTALVVYSKFAPKN